MGLADRDYYKEKIKELEEEKFPQKNKKFFKILFIILIILIIVALILFFK